MHALRAWMGSDLDVIMVGTWMLCGHGRGLIWTLSWLVRAWMGSDLDVIMVGTLRIWMGSECGVTSGSRAKP